MKLSRFKLMLILPIPIAVAVGYYGSQYIKVLVADLIKEHTRKGTAQVPDIELIKGDLDKEVLKVLASLRIGGEGNREGSKGGASEAGTQKQVGPPNYELSFTYISSGKKYAIINGMLFTEGQNVSSEERIIKITKEGVLLSGKWGKRWLKVVD